MNINVLNVSDVELKKDSDGRIIEVVASTTKGTTEIYPVEYDVNKNISKIGHIPVSWGIPVQKELTPLVLNFGQVSSIQPFSALVADVVTIDWGDGNSTVYANIDTDLDISQAEGVSHTYTQSGNYNISIMFDNLTKIIFNYGLVSIGGKLNGCENLENISDMFQYQFNHPTISSDIFDDCTNLKSIRHLFFSSNVVIPENLFKNVNTSGILDTLSFSFFSGSVPSDIFQYFNYMSNFSDMFRRSGITYIPPNIFDKHAPYMTNVDSCFSDCPYLSGNVIELWDREKFPNISNYEGCYYGLNSSNITNYDSIPLLWKERW